MDTPEVIGIPNGRFVENCWLIVDRPTGATAVIDPGEDAEAILRVIREHHLDVRAIWLTHAHLDHIWGVDQVRRATGAPVRLHPADGALYDRSPEQASLYGIADFPHLAPPDGELAAGDRLTLGPWQFEVRAVPGHSPGHVAFVGHGLCISGDVLFLDSIGRTDLPGGNTAMLLASIERELLSLPDATRVLPGHGEPTTIGRERRQNPFLRPLPA